jgi:hypothetical protein
MFGHFASRRLCLYALSGAVVFAAAACGPPPPPRTRVVVVEQPAPPGEIVEVLPPQPGPEYIWIKGHHRWDPAVRGYVWERGHWAVPPQGYRVWVAGRWRNDGGHWFWVEGHWAA